MEKKYILVIDEGTTGLRSLLFDRQMHVVSQNYQKVDSYYPAKAEVEQDPIAIYEKTVLSMRTTVKEAGIDPSEIAGIGITTQRGTWTVWDKKTGEPYYNFVVWLDTRGQYVKDHFIKNQEFCDKFPVGARSIGRIGSHMGAVFYSVLENHPELKEKVKSPDTAWGLMDTWLIYKLTGGKTHASSTSATGTFIGYGFVHPDTITWEADILPWFGMRPEIMPEIKDDVADYGMLDKEIFGVEIPILASAADQQSALFSEGCHTPGTAKCTMGTGSFVDVNVGTERVISPDLSSMVAWRINGVTNYLLEGFSPTAGACLEWAKDQLKLFETFADVDILADKVDSNGGVYFVPAILGMDGLPFNSTTGRASFMGIQASVTREHFVRSVLEGIGFAASFIFEIIKENIGDMSCITVDGGVTRSDLVLQIMADITGATVSRPKLVEATALGSAEMTAIGLGWIKQEDVFHYIEPGKEFHPREDEERQRTIKDYKMWLKAVERSKNWL